MKVLSVAIPSYNSEKYLNKCVDSLLASGDGIEILIVNDGSSDRTAEIADQYEAEYPGRVRAIHQQNAGHGGAVNAGIANATGKYFKVVDSDDWVDSEALKKAVVKLQEFLEKKQHVDMVLANFMYDKVGKEKKKVMKYKGIIPEEQIVTWEEIDRFPTGKYILMHSVIYRLDVLKKCGLKLPEHTFYVDNLFVYEPLPYVHTVYYMNLCIYHYFIGRDEQSVNETNMIKRIDQQLLVNRSMIENVDLFSVKNRTKRNYMLQYLTIITTVSSVLLLKSGTKENVQKKKDFWKYIHKKNPKLFYRMRLSLLGNITNMPGKIGRKFTVLCYKQAQRKVGFN